MRAGAQVIGCFCFDFNFFQAESARQNGIKRTLATISREGGTTAAMGDQINQAKQLNNGGQRVDGQDSKARRRKRQERR